MRHMEVQDAKLVRGKKHRRAPEHQSQWQKVGRMRVANKSTRQVLQYVINNSARFGKTLQPRCFSHLAIHRLHSETGNLQMRIISPSLFQESCLQPHLSFCCFKANAARHWNSTQAIGYSTVHQTRPRDQSQKAGFLGHKVSIMIVLEPSTYSTLHSTIAAFLETSWLSFSLQTLPSLWTHLWAQCHEQRSLPSKSTRQLDKSLKAQQHPWFYSINLIYLGFKLVEYCSCVPQIRHS